MIRQRLAPSEPSPSEPWQIVCRESRWLRILHGCVIVAALAAIAFALFRHVQAVHFAYLGTLLPIAVFALGYETLRLLCRPAQESLTLTPAAIHYERWFPPPRKQTTVAAADVVAIDFFEGLRIATRQEGILCAFAQSPPLNMAYVAERLRAKYGVAEWLPRAPNDIAVYYTGTFWETPVAAVLHPAVGQFTLRHPLTPTPHLFFYADKRPRGRPAIYLTETDVACRIGGMDEPSELALFPPGVRCQLTGGKGRMLVPVFGPLLHHDCWLPGGMLRCDVGSTWTRPFEMTITCEDGAGLQTALARFWGAEG